MACARTEKSFSRRPCVTLAIQTLVSTAVYCAPVMAPAAAPALGVAPAAVGYFVTVVYLGSMIGTVTAGGWVGRFGPILVSQAGLLLCLAGLARRRKRRAAGRARSGRCSSAWATGRRRRRAR